MNLINDNQTLIKFENITKIFKNGRGITNITFNVPKGAILGLIGNNGARKTTLLKTFFKEYNIDSGDVYLNNEILKIDDLKQMAFFPDQNSMPKIFNVLEFARFCAELKGLKRKDYGARLKKLVNYLHLEKLTKSNIYELSAGQQKRAILLSVLVTNPNIIVLDEPTANLDIDARMEFQHILKTLSVELGITIIITSHIIDEMENLIDYVVLLKDGHLVYEDKYNLQKDGKLEKIYLEYVTNNHNNKVKQQTKSKNGTQAINNTLADIMGLTEN